MAMHGQNHIKFIFLKWLKTGRDKTFQERSRGGGPLFWIPVCTFSCQLPSSVTCRIDWEKGFIDSPKYGRDYKNIINFIRAQRLSWLGHVERMQGTRIVKAIYSWYPISSRPRGRTKTRWMDDIRKDIQKLKVLNWKTLTQTQGVSSPLCISNLQ